MYLYIFVVGYLRIFFPISSPPPFFLSFLFRSFAVFPRFLITFESHSQPRRSSTRTSMFHPPIEYQNFYSSTPAFYSRCRPIKRLYRRNKPMNPRRSGFSEVFREECEGGGGGKGGFRIYWQRVGDSLRQDGTIDIDDELQERMNCTRLDRLKNYQRCAIISRQSTKQFDSIIKNIYISFNKFQEFRDRVCFAYT